MASTDITYVSRVVYNLFMLISDVGGLSGFLVSLAAALVSVFTYKNAENHLVELLFSSQDPDQETRLNHRKQHALVEWVQNKILSSCMMRGVCLRRSRHTNLFIEGRERLSR